MTTEPALEPSIADLARREAACCAFLHLETVVADGSLVLEITSPQADALPVNACLAGIALP